MVNQADGQDDDGTGIYVSLGQVSFPYFSLWCIGCFLAYLFFLAHQLLQFNGQTQKETSFDADQLPIYLGRSLCWKI